MATEYKTIFCNHWSKDILNLVDLLMNNRDIGLYVNQINLRYSGSVSSWSGIYVVEVLIHKQTSLFFPYSTDKDNILLPQPNINEVPL